MIDRLCVYDDGSGPALVAAGEFTMAGGVEANKIAAWRSGRWRALGAGSVTKLQGLCAFNDGSGPALYTGSPDSGIVRKWKSGAWASLPTLSAGVYSLCVYDDGGGAALYAGGAFSALGRVAKWTGSTWQALGTGIGGVNPTLVRAMCVYDDGSGPALIAGGTFTTAGGLPANNIARWKDGAWQPLGDGMGAVYALCVYDDGTGPALYAAGLFDLHVNYVLKWQNGVWVPLGSGTNNFVYALCAYDDGNGPALYAGGPFSKTGGVSTNCIAMWRDGEWHAVPGLPASSVSTLCVCDGALFVGGGFISADGHRSTFIARWSCEPAPAAVDAGSAKRLPNCDLVSLNDQSSTAVLGSSFYIEDADRSNGIRVDLPGHAIARDRRVSVTGRLMTDLNGERYIYGFSAIDLGPLTVKPLGLNTRSLAGADWAYDLSTGAGQQGVTDGCGLSSTGLLVRVAGRFIAGGTNWLCLDDGGGHAILCTVPVGVAINPTWERISVTGISSLMSGATGLSPLIRVRTQDDIVSY